MIISTISDLTRCRASFSRPASGAAKQLFLMLMILAGFTAATHADPAITLPLNGYYRSGKFFPVAVTADHPVDIQIDIPNGIGSRATGTSVTLPAMFLTGSERSLRVVIDGKPTDLPMRALEANQKLMIVLAKDFPTAPKVVLHDASLVTVSLSLQPNEISQAYESADFLAVPDSPETEMNPNAFTSFRSLGGTLLRIPESAAQTPFRPAPSVTVASLIRGPTSSLDDAGPYDAVSALVAGRSPGLRRTVGLALVIFSIAVLGTALLGRRWSVLAIASLALAWFTIGGVVLAKQSPITERQAWIDSSDTGGHQDRWVFKTTLRETQDTFDASSTVCRPLFNGQAGSLHMWVEPLGLTWRFHYTLPRGGTVGLVCRSNSAELVPPESSEPPLFGEVVRRYYQRPGETATLSPQFAGRYEVWEIEPAK